MQKISNLVPTVTPGQPLASSNALHPTTGALPTKWADALLAKFAAIWGHRWTGAIAGIPDDVLAGEWAEGMAGATGEQIRAGIAHCRANCDWPPSIAEFRRACGISTSTPGRLVSDPSHQLYLPTPPRTREARENAQAALQAIRDTLPATDTPAALPEGVASLVGRKRRDPESPEDARRRLAALLERNQ